MPGRGKIRKLHHEDPLVPMETDSPSPPSGTAQQSIGTSFSTNPPSAPPTTPSSGVGAIGGSRFRSDQIVSRMKLFFQSGSSSKTDSSTSGPSTSADRSGVGGGRSQSTSRKEARR